MSFGETLANLDVEDGSENFFQIHFNKMEPKTIDGNISLKK
jgi:hypothetical protein